MNYFRIFAILSLLFFSQEIYSQCATGVPELIVNLTGSPDSVWSNSTTVRETGTSIPKGCCANGERCVKMVITLDPNADGIRFDVLGGTGTTEYQIGCGAVTAVNKNVVICLNGVGPHILTFCKPGSNALELIIYSVPKATAGTDVIVSNNCIGRPTATGFDVTTIAWTSVFPGATGAFNNYLSCASNCLSPIVSPPLGSTPPAFIDYKVCGIPSATCSAGLICDTVRVTFLSALAATIAPPVATICFGQPTIVLTATGSGGLAPYRYNWNTIPVQTTSIVNVTAGTYTVTVSDGTACTPATATRVVTSFASSITAFAGADAAVCAATPTVILNGSVTGVTTGIWSGGAGNFNPSITTLVNVTYTPTPAEITAGFVDLTLTTTNNGTCPSASDVVRITINPTPGAAVSVVPIACKGLLTGAVTGLASGPATPYSFSWNTSPVKTTQSLTGIAAGTYTVTITDANNCVNSATGVVTEPPSFFIATISSVIPAGCDGGSIISNVTGGVPGYSYSWVNSTSTNQIASTPNISGLLGGTYTVTVTDAAGCEAKVANITVPTNPPFTVIATVANVTCFGAANGSISLAASGGKTPYTYTWNGGISTGASVTGLSPANYTVTVADNAGCDTTILIPITQPTDLVLGITNVQNILCAAKLGTVTATATGGTSAYSFLWSNGVTNASITGLTVANTYVVTLTDSHGCKKIASQVITAVPIVTFTAVITNVLCFGNNTGAISLNGVAGGAPTLSYTWSPVSSTTNSITGLGAATYNVQITDINSCITTFTGTVTQPAAPLSISTFSSSNVSCFGGNNGSANITVAGGTSSYTFTWTGGVSATSSATGLVEGTYVVTVTDVNSCTVNHTFTITQPTSITASITNAVNINCADVADGRISVSANGGTGILSYLWSSGGQTTANITGLSAGGVYSVTVRDANLCSVNLTQNLNINPLLVTAVATPNTICFGASNGALNITPSGGDGTYTYLWTPNGETTQDIAGLTAGNYTVIVYDSKGCDDTVTVAINQNPQITVAETANSPNASCPGPFTGSSTVNASGGAGGFSYSWNTAPVITGTTATGLAGGIYLVTVTDGLLCMGNTSIIITDNAGPSGVILSKNDLRCFGDASGQGVATYTVGANPISSFEWINVFTNALVSTNLTATGLTPGRYLFRVTDSGDCVGVDSITINEPSNLTAFTNQQNILCFDEAGSAGVSVFGGIPPYDLLWDDPSASTTANVTGLFAGTYTVSATDMNTCTVTNQVILNEPSDVLYTFNSKQDVSCFGFADGEIITNIATGGVGSFTYEWVPYGGTAPVAAGLSGGTFTAYVHDLNNCADSLTIVIDEPPLFTSSATSVTTISCNAGLTGSIGLTTNGGFGTYHYLWTPGAYTNATVTGLAAGNYSIEVKDDNDCTVNINQFLGQPATPIGMLSSVTNVKCNSNANGEVSLNVSGGTPNYNYTWSPNVGTNALVSGLTFGTYTVLVRDANLCTLTNVFNVTQPATLTTSITTFSNISCFGISDGSATSTTSGGTLNYAFNWQPSAGNGSSISGVPAGIYTLTVNDAHNCLTTNVVTITQPAVLTLVATHTNVQCFGNADGTANLNANGGTPGYTYTWNLTPPGTTTNSSVIGLVSANYSVTVSDQNSCVANTDVPITEPNPLSVSIVILHDTKCNLPNGSATAAAAGGTTPYTFSWSGGGSTSQTITGLAANTYTVTVTDAQGCQATSSVFTVAGSNAITASITNTPVSCFGGHDGTATVTTGNTIAPIDYTWSPNVAVTPIASNLTSGVYSVTVVDAQGCIASTFTSVSQPATALTLTAPSITTVTCFSTANGQLIANPTGGSGGYQYLWTPINTTNQVAAGLLAGDYTIKVTDIKGCTITDTYTIIEPDQIVTAISPQPPYICPNMSATLNASATGGDGNYTFTWNANPDPAGSFPQTTNSLTVSPLITTTYTLTAIDGANCSTGLSADMVINVSNPTLRAFSSATICEGNFTTIAAEITGSYPTATWNYLWSNGQTIISGFDVSPTVKTTYTLTAQNDCGQALTDNVIIDVINTPKSNIVPLQKTLCGSDSVEFANTLAHPEGTEYEYMWNFENTFFTDSLKPKYSFSETGDYPVILVITDRGCMGINVAVAHLDVSEPPIANFNYTPEEVLELNPTVNFNNTSLFANYYKWYFTEAEKDSSFMTNPIYQYADTGNFKVKLIAYKIVGDSVCIDTTIKVVRIGPESTLFIPNAFTPNEDKFNPLFQAKGINLKELYMEIYNRWGTMIYKTADPTDLNSGWDGTYKGVPAKQDVYVYRIVARDINGKKYTVVGNITLLR